MQILKDGALRRQLTAVLAVLEKSVSSNSGFCVLSKMDECMKCELRCQEGWQSGGAEFFWFGFLLYLV